MAQPALRIGSAQAAQDAARSLDTPSEVQHFESLASGSPAVRAFLSTPEWAEIRARIMGDGHPPLGRPRSFEDLARLFRWTADGAFSETRPTDPVRAAYLHAAREVEAYARSAQRAEPVSPAPGTVEYVPGLAGARVAVPRPAEAQPVEDGEVGLSFGAALMSAQAGRHIARWAWAEGSYVTAQAGYPQGIGVNANTAAATGLPEGSKAAFSPYLMMCVPARDAGPAFPPPPPTFMPWTPGQDDLFAADWAVLPRPAQS
jgi:hypothetical protein